MGYSRRWKPSKKQAHEFVEQMKEIESFCIEHGISASTSRDSYYFRLNGKAYRVSNHSVESSPYHDGREEGTVYIHASKTRIIEIYNNLANGLILDGKGYVKA